MVATQLIPFVAACAAFGISVLFFPVLPWSGRGRGVVFVLLATLVLLMPWTIPSEARVARFMVAIYSGVLVLKLWDLHLGAGRGVRPPVREFLGFLVNLPTLVHRRTGCQPQPSPRENGLRLVSSLIKASLALSLLHLLNRLDWGWTTFLVEHLLKATVFFVGATALFTSLAAFSRILGGYAPEPMNRPLMARTPAEFWRRYNRWIGEGLREDLFRPLGGRRHRVLATLAVFAVSGLLHEYLFWTALGRIQGFQLAFFGIQGAAVVLTSGLKPGRIIGVGTTFAFNVLSSIFFFASFQGLVPFYDHALPEWLWGV